MKNAMQLKAALKATTQKRSSFVVVSDYRKIINIVKGSEVNM